MTAEVRIGLFILGLLTSLKGIQSLQCYNCGGITNYDPQSCFEPLAGKTIIQECSRGEVCEKKITRVDRLQDVVERGCSSNCDGRDFVWTDTFRVYCCQDERCNHGDAAMATKLSVLLPIAVMVWTFLWRRNLTL